jgi:hypothetical protein
MIVRVAWGLALCSAPEHRWRQIALPLSAAICVLLGLAAASVIGMVGREAERAQGRTALVARVPGPRDLFFVERDDDWRGEQFPVVWIEPAGTATPVLPRGMERMPEPGQAAVSPALHRLASENPELAARYPDHIVLAWEGIASGDELLAYVRVPEGRTLRGAFREKEAVRVRDFGAGTSTSSSWRVGYYEPLPIVALVVGVLGVLVLPGMIVLTAGVATASTVRDHRFGMLRWLGASSRTLVVLASVETLILAVPGFITTMVLWIAVTPRLDRVPFVGHGVAPGDLGLPWQVILALTIAYAVAAALLGVVMTAIRELYVPTRPRPTSRSVPPSPLRVVPFVLAIAVTAYGALVRSGSGDLMMIASIAATAAATPLALPNLLQVVGARLGRLDPVPALVAGRSMAWDPVRIGRPFAVGSALAVLALAGNGWIAYERDTDSSGPPGAALQVAAVWWFDPKSGDPSRLTAALRSGMVAPFRHEHGSRDEHDHQHASEFVVGATCLQLAQYLPGTVCHADEPYTLPHEASHSLAIALGEPEGEATLARPETVAGRSAVVLDRAPIHLLHERVRTAAMRVLPAPTVQSRQSWVGEESPLARWLLGGLGIGLVSLMIGGVLSMVDRLLATRGHRRHLLALGLGARRVAAIEVWSFAAPFIASMTVGFSTGLALCALISVRTGAQVPLGGASCCAGIGCDDRAPRCGSRSLVRRKEHSRRS